MSVSRRDALKTFGAAAVTPALRFKTAQPDTRDSVLTAIAEVVLPAEADRKTAVAAFAGWIDNYKEGADTDHGYGNTRIRATGPSPARNYPAQIAALDVAARAKGAAGFTAASLDQRRAILEQAIADAKVERLPTRPTGAHLATDLMGHYLGSSQGQDLCYRANIARDACRGLPGSEKPPTSTLRPPTSTLRPPTSTLQQ
jgi:Gluconate 2-dehydrogenase subunit 3